MRRNTTKASAKGKVMSENGKRVGRRRYPFVDVFGHVSALLESFGHGCRVPTVFSLSRAWVFYSLIRTIEASPLNYFRSEIKINRDLFCISLT